MVNLQLKGDIDHGQMAKVGQMDHLGQKHQLVKRIGLVREAEKSYG